MGNSLSHTHPHPIKNLEKMEIKKTYLNFSREGNFVFVAEVPHIEVQAPEGTADGSCEQNAGTSLSRKDT